MAGENPPLPSNYVSLAVLKERWLEQQRKQREEEELQKKHEEDQKKKIQNRNRDKSLQKSQSSSLHASARNHKVTRIRDGQTSVASKPTLKECKSEVSVSVSKVERVEGKLNKKAKETQNTRRKSRAEKTLSVPTPRSTPVEKLQVDTAERKDKVEEAGCKFPHNSDHAANDNVWKPRVRISTAGKTNHQYSKEFSNRGFSSRSPQVQKLQADSTERNYKIEEAGCEFPHSSVDQAANLHVSEHRVIMSTAGKTLDQYSRYSQRRDFLQRRNCHQRRDFHQKQTDCKQVWIKKGETAATQSSGLSVNTGRASSSNGGKDTKESTSIW